MRCCLRPRSTASPPTSSVKPLAAEVGSISGALMALVIITSANSTAPLPLPITTGVPVPDQSPRIELVAGAIVRVNVQSYTSPSRLLATPENVLPPDRVPANKVGFAAMPISTIPLEDSEPKRGTTPPVPQFDPYPTQVTSSVPRKSTGA